MSQTVYITYTEDLKTVADITGNNIFFNEKIKIESIKLSASNLISMAKKSTTEFFYVINTDREIDFGTFDFSFKPPEWDKMYLHIWDKELRVRLYNKKLVLENAEHFSDDSITAGVTELKVHSDCIFKYPVADVIFLSYDETYADRNFKMLKTKVPNAKRVHGVKGILQAHIAAAKLAKSNFFYVVDADAEIVEDFNFDYYPDGYNSDTVHVWNSINPVNGLIYGYGGVKLFPRNRVLDYTGSPVDFTTSVSKHFKVMNCVSNITKFNTDPFSTWRSAFRECTKLASNIIDNHYASETEERLRIWCTVTNGAEFSEYATMGALAGREFGTKYKNQPEMFGLINDYAWLEQKFNN